MALGPALRSQWTVKSRRIDQELVTGCRLAAERQGMGMGDWVVETLREWSQAILKDEAPTHPPPARLEDVAGPLAEMITSMAATQEQRLAQIGREQLEAIQREAKRGRWRR